MRSAVVQPHAIAAVLSAAGGVLTGGMKIAEERRGLPGIGSPLSFGHTISRVLSVLKDDRPQPLGLRAEGRSKGYWCRARGGPLVRS